MLDYKIYLDGTLIYSPYDDTYKMYEAKLELNQNDISTFEFTLYEPGTANLKIYRMKSEVDVYQGETRIFKGIVIEDDRTMENEVTIKCKDELYFLAQTLQRPASYGSKTNKNSIIVDENGDEQQISNEETVTVPVAGIFKDYIAKHNAESTHKFMVGNVDIEAQGIVENSDYKTTWDAISALINDYGGFIDFVHNGDNLIISWLKDFKSTAEQEARFTSNLTSVQINESALDMATVLIPTGDTIESNQIVTDENGDEQQVTTSAALSIKDVNGGLDYIQDDSAVAQYGRIMKHKSYSGIKDPKVLLEMAKTDLDELVKHTQSITVKMIDLAGVDDSKAPILLGKYIVINDPVNSINDKYLPLKISRDLFNPENNEIELTATRQTQSATAFSGTVNGASRGLVGDSARRDSEYMEVVKAQKGYIDDLHAKSLDVEYLLTAFKAKVKFFEADSAKIKNLETDFFTVNSQANINKANIDELYSKTAVIDNLTNGYSRIGVLDNDLANIKSLIAGNVQSDGIQSIVINSKNSTIENGMITNAMIDSIQVDKITGLDLNTTKLTVHSADGRSTWKDNTIQIKDANNKLRVQLGKDAKGDYTIYLYDKDGKVLFDPLGLTADGINRQVIDNDAVMDNAMIAGSKLDIDSVIKSVNSSTTSIKANRIYFDEKKQSLNAFLNQMDTTVTADSNSVKTLSTQLTAANGSISALIAKTNSTNKRLSDSVDDLNGKISNVSTSVSTVTTQYNDLKKTVDTNASSIGKITTNVTTLTNKTDNMATTITSTSSKLSTIEQNLSGFKSTVSETYSTKTEMQNISNSVNDTKKSLSETKTALSTSIAQTANGIRSEVAATYANKSKMISYINQSPESIKIQANRIDIDGLVTFNNSSNAITKKIVEEITGVEIGGRNLLFATKDFGIRTSDYGYPYIRHATIQEDGVRGNKALVSNADNNGTGWYDVLGYNKVFNSSNPFKPDTDYTLSFYVKADKETTFSSLFYPSALLNDGQTSSTATTEWKRIVITWHTRMDSNYVNNDEHLIVARIETNSTKNVKLYISSPKFEEGNKATDWSPAPEDVEVKIEDVDKKATATDLLVSNWCNINDKTLIDGSKIYTGTITADKLNVNEMRGTNGVIYLKDGTFDYGNGRLKWDGSNLTVNGNITATTGQIASFTIRGAYLESTDEQVGLSAGNTSFWAGFNGNDGSYKFRVTKDGYVYASNADISGTISNSLIKWRSGSGDFGTIEARSSLMANGSGIPGQETRGMIIAGYLGSTIDIGIRGNENNSLENYAWYSAIHINGNSIAIRNPGTDISSYILIAGSKITIDANASSQEGGLNTGTVEVHGGTGYYTLASWMRIYAHTAITGGLEVDGLQNGNGLQTANMRSNSSGSYLEVKCANNSNAYGVSAWLSDARYKNSIMTTKVNASSILRRIAFKQFNWNDSGIHVDIGLVAQELNDIDSDLVMKINQPDGSFIYQVNDVMMTTVTAKAVQETISEVDSLKLENMNLKARLSYLEEKVKYLNGENSLYSEDKHEIIRNY